jgi:hypothetical protein
LKAKHSSHRIVWQYDNRRQATGEEGKVRFVALITIAILLSARAPAAQSSDVENFYRGHSISMIVWFGVGGGYDLYSRLISRFMGKYLPGNPAIIPQNMTGAGSLRAVNYLYSIAPKDGSVIGTFFANTGTFTVAERGRLRQQKIHLARQRRSGRGRLLHFACLSYHDMAGFPEHPVIAGRGGRHC